MKKNTPTWMTHKMMSKGGRMVAKGSTRKQRNGSHGRVLSRHNNRTTHHRRAGVGWEAAGDGLEGGCHGVIGRPIVASNLARGLAMTMAGVPKRRLQEGVHRHRSFRPEPHREEMHLPNHASGEDYDGKGTAVVARTEQDFSGSKHLTSKALPAGVDTPASPKHQNQR